MNPEASQDAVSPPLPAAERARGRLLAITSHPAGMTHRMVLTGDHLPTLVLVALGASEAMVGLQRTLVYLAIILQLPMLRLVGRFHKRSILVAGQLVALLGTLPLLWFGALESLGPASVGIALTCFGVAAAGFAICETVWFPLLHGFQESDRIGRFFAILRTGWHLTLIVYFLGAQRWLAENPGSFSTLFGVAFALGVFRILLIARLPERSERTGSVIHVREALALLRSNPLLRRYLAGIALAGSVRTIVFTFAIVMLRRVVGFSEGQVLYTTVSLFAGGLASLWLWGLVVDRAGPEPVFRWTAIGQAVLFLGFFGVVQNDTTGLVLAIALFFGLWALGSGFDVADTHVIFALAPSEAPARMIVVARVLDSLARGVAPLAVGIALDRLLATGLDPLGVYRGLFAVCAAVLLLAILPLRSFRRRIDVVSEA